MKVDVSRIKYYLVKSGRNEGKYHYRYDRGNNNYMHIGRFDHVLSIKEMSDAYKRAYIKNEDAIYYDNNEPDEWYEHREKNNREADMYHSKKWWKETAEESMHRLSQSHPNCRMVK